MTSAQLDNVAIGLCFAGLFVAYVVFGIMFVRIRLGDIREREEQTRRGS